MLLVEQSLYLRTDRKTFDKIIITQQEQMFYTKYDENSLFKKKLNIYIRFLLIFNIQFCR